MPISFPAVHYTVGQVEIISLYVPSHFFFLGTNAVDVSCRCNTCYVCAADTAVVLCNHKLCVPLFHSWPESSTGWQTLQKNTLTSRRWASRTTSECVNAAAPL